MVKELEDLCNECRSNSCIEHALGIIEDKKTQENLSEKVSNISLTGTERVHMFLLIQCSFCFFFLLVHYHMTGFF